MAMRRLPSLVRNSAEACSEVYAARKWQTAALLARLWSISIKSCDSRVAFAIDPRWIDHKQSRYSGQVYYIVDSFDVASPLKG